MAVSRAKSVIKDSRISQMRMADSSPEKAGVGGSIPSLATTFSKNYGHFKTDFHSVSFQNFSSAGMRQRNKAVLGDCITTQEAPLQSSSRLPVVV